MLFTLLAQRLRFPAIRITPKPNARKHNTTRLTRANPITVRKTGLAGELLDSEPDVWTHTNVPAVADSGVPDALGRAPGVAMVSALGYTPEHYAAARRTSGERAWWALYMGQPSSPEGGLVKREWLDSWRMPCAPTHSVFTVIGVDPSDSGSGDSCGIVAASMTSDGVVAVIADVSRTDDLRRMGAGRCGTRH